MRKSIEITKYRLVIILKNQKKFYQIIMAVITISALNISGVLPSYNIISMVLLYILGIFYINNLNYNKQYKFILYISIILSMLLVLGNICIDNLYTKDVSILLEFLKPINLFIVLGYFGLIYAILNYAVPRLVELRIKSDKKIISSKKLFIILFIIIIKNKCLIIIKIICISTIIIKN